MKPHAISPEEWAELRDVTEVQESWGLEPDEDAESLANFIYGVRFDYQSDCPGYVGPLYLLVGGGHPNAVLTITRARDGSLVPVQALPATYSY